MKLVHTIEDLQRNLAEARAKGEKIGLVPTMGALHEGHASLVRRCAEENEVTVVSVFLNPTQFNDKKDLEKYPRTLDADCRLLESVGADIVFAPSVEEMYPQPDNRKFSYPPVDSVMEGAFRPGHFNGVCQIVSKLFGMVKPHRAYFGEKDFQQIAVIRRMVELEGFEVEIVDCPIVREADGLALSSRNVRLTPEGRQVAPGIHRVLAESVRLKENGMNPGEVEDEVVRQINSLPGLTTEYFSIVDAITMQPLAAWESAGAAGAVGCVTVYCGDVRLIDNIRY